MTDLEALTLHIREESHFLRAAEEAVGEVIVGQKNLIKRMMMGLLADGHVLLEGVPGLAKTMAVHALATAFGGDFRRIQFTPDLLPSDLLGTQVYNPKNGDWSLRKGPIFGNFVLADEINRAPAKVQSALLEAMQEREVTLAGETHALPESFLVLATQNPVEQEGTYPLPEAQVDRFMLKIVVSYPSKAEEKKIIQRMARNAAKPMVEMVAGPEDILRGRRLLDEIYVDHKIMDYVVDLIFATREPEQVGLADLKNLILYGASPRASIALIQAARAFALLEGRGYVIPEDVRSVGMDVLRHRVIPTYEAEAEGLRAEDLVQRVFDAQPAP